MISTVTSDRCFDIRGLSSDEKPISWNGIPIANGSTFFAMDTCEVFMFNETAQVWVKL